jgi:long-chain acyl-CoA synthetase
MTQPWLAGYPAEVPAEISTDGFQSLTDLLAQACRRHAARPALVSMGRAMTYAELDANADALAAWIQQTGMPKGSRIVLMMPNVMAYMVVLLGVLRAGMVAVGGNPLYTARELTHLIKDSGAKAVFVLENFAATLADAGAQAPVEHTVVVSVGDFLGVKGALVNFVLRHVRKKVHAYHLPGSVPLRRALALGKKRPFQPVPAAMDDVAILQYTGGTTGVPKGAMLTHHNLVANVLQVQAVARPVLRGEPMAIMAALPLYHIFALMVCGLFALHMGMRCVLVANPRDLDSLVDAWRRDPVDIFPAVNTLFNGLANFPAFAKLDFSRLRLCFGGGAAVQRSVAENWQRITGRPIIEGYGLSETSPLACVNPTDSTAYSGDIGLPVPSTDMAMLDDAGRRQPYGTPGEVGIRGPQVMKGYWRRPDETQNAFTADGFFRTGDIGIMSPEGRIRLIDRKKDMILVSGFNVYPAEVEDVAALHPGVLECVAVGIPDARTGEAVKLFVVPKDPGLTEEALLEWCAGRLTAYKRPHACEFRSSLPKSNVGKILRRELRDESTPRSSDASE